MIRLKIIGEYILFLFLGVSVGNIIQYFTFGTFIWDDIDVGYVLLWIGMMTLFYINDVNKLKRKGIIKNKEDK